jgi:release factor glutamine methyltransferase
LNLRQALAHAREALASKNIEDTSLEGEVLLRHVLGIDRTQLFMNLDIELDIRQEKALEKLLERRIKGEPTAYITGHREFYGLDFNVNRSVLIPRPETELLVEKAIELAQSREIDSIIDAGTGCGAIAVALAVNLPKVKIYATDISDAALEVAASNCKKHHVSDRITLLHGDMLEPVPEKVDLIAANLPYVITSDLPGSGPLSHEPPAALNGGPDGLDILKNLFVQSVKKLKPGGCVLAEIGEGQSIPVVNFIRDTYQGAQIETWKDLSGIERVTGLRLTKSLP